MLSIVCRNSMDVEEIYLFKSFFADDIFCLIKEYIKINNNKQVDFSVKI
jgi:hypothetical protein